MYAVIQTGGKQYRVQEGDVLRVEKLDAEVGKKVDFEQVLMIGDGGDVKAGKDAEKFTVSGVVTDQGKGKKVIIFKRRRRKNFRRTKGHRQMFTAVRIDQIGTAKAKPAAKPEAATEAKPEAKAKTAAKPATATKAKAAAKPKTAAKAATATKAKSTAKPATATKAKAATKDKE